MNLQQKGMYLGAKQRPEFSHREAQLITYLAILREARRRMGKANTVTQGFYTDGIMFVFVCITTDGVIEESEVWDINRPAHFQMVYSWIIQMMETAMKSTPNALLTKLGLYVGRGPGRGGSRRLSPGT